MTKNILKFLPKLSVVLSLLSLPACHLHKEEEPHHEQHKIVLTSPKAKDVTITQQYVCQIRSQQNIEVCALSGGRLDDIPVREGQWVKKGDVLFKVVPVLYQARLDAELAEVRVAQIECDNTKKLLNANVPVVSATELSMYEAKLAKAQAKAKQAEVELNFATVRAPFDGIVDRLQKQLGSTVKEGEVLTTLSDNSTMWVYYNVPEVRYLDYMANLTQNQQEQKIELVLANGCKFPQAATSVRIEAKFNNETGNIPFRADFPNPSHLLRHGQTGNILIHRTLKGAIVIPQRATFEILDKRYVYVVGKDDVAHQREITVLHEMEDIFVIKNGLTVDDKIVLEGVQQIHEGQKIELSEFHQPEKVIANQKNHAE